MNKNKAFTLVEILVAMAIVGILATVVMVQVAGYSKQARASKALAQLSSVVPSMYSCWGNGGTVNSPTGGAGGTLVVNKQICNLSTSYGYWPQTVGDLDGYSYYGPGSSTLPADTWYVTVTSSPSDDFSFCCGKAIGGCKIHGTYLQRSSCNYTTLP